MSDKDKIRQEIERRKKENMYDDLPITIGRYYEDRDLLAFIDSLPDEKPSEDLEEAAQEYAIPFNDTTYGCEYSYKGFIAGAEWQAKQLLKGSPLPEDTVLFQKGVEEGRRLERDDDNKALAEMYGYEGGTESPLVKITFTIPKEHFKKLMPIKQGDVFGIENLTNKEERR